MGLPKCLLDNLLLAQEEVEKNIKSTLEDLQKQRMELPSVIDKELKEYSQQHPKILPEEIARYRNKLLIKYNNSIDEKIMELGNSRGSMLTLIEIYRNNNS